MKKLVLLLLVAGLIIGCGGKMTKEEMDKRMTVLEAKYESKDWTVRMGSVEEASSFMTDRSFIFLERALSDRHVRVRIEAVKGISMFNDERGYLLLLENAKKGDLNVRYEATKGLIVYKRAESYPVFKEGLKSRDWLLREASITGILEIKDSEVEKESVDDFLKAMNDDTESVRLAALRSVRIKDERIYLMLRRYFENEKYQLKTTYTIAVLTAMRGYKLDEPTEMKIKELIVHPNKDVRIMALRVLKSVPEN